MTMPATPTIATVTEADDIQAEPEPARTSRRWPWVLLLLVLAGAVAAALYARHTLQQGQNDAARWQADSEALDRRLAELERGIGQLRQNQQALTQRIDSTSATHQVLREEVLGMGERAGLLEDAVARLSQSRMSGDALLRLNEAEFLLSMGSERLSLYADVPATIQAFSLAEGTLAGLDDPALSTLRQTLAQELIQLRAVPPDPRPQLRAELAQLAAQLANLPVSREGEVETLGAGDSRLAQLLGQLVTVRRVDSQTTLLGPAQRQAALAAIALQLELAQAALARPDQAAFDSALAQVENNAAGLFDAGQAEVQHWFERITELRQARLLPQLPVLGATLRELRALRAARHVGRGSALELPAVQPQRAAPVAEAGGEMPEDSASSTSDLPLEPEIPAQADASPEDETAAGWDVEREGETGDEADTESDSPPETEPNAPPVEASEPADDGHGATP